MGIAAVASILVGLSTQPAAPTATGFELQWDAPEACPGADDFSATIGDLLGDPSALERTSVRAQVRIEAQADAWTLHLQIGGGSRDLVAPSCDEIAATAAFLVAIAIDPRVLGRAPPMTVPRRTTPPPLPEPIPTPPPVLDDPPPTHARPPDVLPPPPQPRARAIAVAGRVAGGIGLGPSPRTTGAFAASVGVMGRWFRAEVEGQYWIPRRRVSANNRDVAVIAQLWTIGARGCGVLARGRLEIPLCAVAQAGLIHARGDGDLRSRRARTPWVGLGGGVMAIGWVRERIGIGGGLDVLGSVVAGGFRSEPSGDVDRVEPLALTAVVGVWWRAARPRPQSGRRVLETRRAGQPGG